MVDATRNDIIGESLFHQQKVTPRHFREPKQTRLPESRKPKKGKKAGKLNPQHTLETVQFTTASNCCLVPAVLCFHVAVEWITPQTMPTTVTRRMMMFALAQRSAGSAASATRHHVTRYRLPAFRSSTASDLKLNMHNKKATGYRRWEIRWKDRKEESGIRKNNPCAFSIPRFKWNVKKKLPRKSHNHGANGQKSASSIRFQGLWQGAPGDLQGHASIRYFTGRF